MKLIISILIIICLFLGFSWYSERNANNKEREYFTLNDSLLQKKVVDTRDSAGRQIQLYKVISISSEQLAYSKSTEVSQLKQDLAKVKRSISDVRSYTSVGVSTHDTIRIPIGDSIKCGDANDFKISFSYNPDTFMSFIGAINLTHFDGGFKIDDIVGVYDVRSGIRVAHLEKDRFWGPPHTELAISSDNPHSDINKVQNYTVKFNPKWYNKTSVKIISGVVIGAIAMHYLKK